MAPKQYKALPMFVSRPLVKITRNIAMSPLPSMRIVGPIASQALNFVILGQGQFGLEYLIFLRAPRPKYFTKRASRPKYFTKRASSMRPKKLILFLLDVMCIL